MKEILHFTIPLNPVSKKNNMQIAIRDVHGRLLEHPRLLPNKKYRDYENKAMWFIPNAKQIDYQVNIKCLFYRETKHTVDLTNLLEAIDDVLVKSELLKDDCYKYIAGHDGSRVLFDKVNPRTEITIERFEGNESNNF